MASAQRVVTNAQPLVRPAAVYGQPVARTYSGQLLYLMRRPDGQLIYTTQPPYAAAPSQYLLPRQ
jgi:hypothetical protein